MKAIRIMLGLLATAASATIVFAVFGLEALLLAVIVVFFVLFAMVPYHLRVRSNLDRIQRQSTESDKSHQ